MKRAYRKAALAHLAGLAVLGVMIFPFGAHAQEGQVTVRVESAGQPLAGAQVSVEDLGALTDAAGSATLRLPPGAHQISARRFGYQEQTIAVEVEAGADVLVVIELEQDTIGLEGIVVQSTRTGRRIEDEPIRVEVLDREEVEEKMLMAPADIAMMLNETSGLRVQTSSAALGGANVRIHGLRGRYTLILSDGLPLYGGQSGGLSMLQIPPMDLEQVEVIKGVASALYGASALGGVVNLVSRRPADEREILLNQTSRGGTDGILWASGQLSDRWGYTFLGSAHRQGIHDVDGDGWADLPGYRRGVVRPRLFWEDGQGRSLFLTVGGTVEEREGGTLAGATMPSGTAHPEELGTRRIDGALVGRVLFGGDRMFTFRASAMGQRHDHVFGDVREEDLHSTVFTEVALTGMNRGHTWVVGAAFQRDGYEGRDVPWFDYSYTVPSLFAQDEISPADWITVAASGRLDAHSEYGTSFHPRLSVLLRPADDWNARASVGTGYFAPTPFTEETEAFGLTPLLPLDGLAVERATTASLDVARAVGRFEINATIFGSEIRDPLVSRTTGEGRVELLNAGGPTRTHGTDLLAGFREDPLRVVATYTFTRSREEDRETGGRREVPLTPRHAAGVVGMWEGEEGSLVGVELYYTGRQELDGNPYRSVSRPYVEMGVLVARRIGPARIFVNFENILDTRQSRFGPMLLPERTPEGRWTVDAWAPVEGRTLNAGVQWHL